MSRTEGQQGAWLPGQDLDTQHLAEQEATQGLLVEPKLREGNGTQNKAGGSALSEPGQQHLGTGSQPERIVVSTSSDGASGAEGRAELQEVIVRLSTPKISQAGSG